MLDPRFQNCTNCHVRIHGSNADPNFLQFFSYPLLRGNKASVLSRPDGAVISAAVAKKYFGDENAIGKRLFVDDDIKGHNFIVTGVMQNVPHNSHLQFDILLPFTVYEHSSNYSYNNPVEWGSYDVYTYLLLDGKFDAQTSKPALRRCKT